MGLYACCSGERTFPRVSFQGGPLSFLQWWQPHDPGNTVLVIPDFVWFSYDIWWPVAYLSSSLRCQPSCKGSFCLGSQPSLATCKGVTVEVVKARCHYCSSKLYLSFGPFETEALYSKGGCARITTLGQPPAGSKMVLSRVRVVKKRWSCEVAGSHHCWFDISWPIAYGPISTSSKCSWLASHPNLAALQEWQLWDSRHFGWSLCFATQGSSAFSIVDLTFHGQRHIFRVRCQPPCSDKCARLRNHPSLATCTVATVEVARARCRYCSSKLCLLFGQCEHGSLQQRRLCKKYFGAATS